MKTNCKIRFVSFAMVIMMLVFNLSTVVFAEEKNTEQLLPENVVSVEKLDNGKIRTAYEFEIIPDDVDENGIATYAVDSSFTMKGTYYRGADRKYSGNYLSYAITVTGSDGNPVNKQVSAQLWDYNGNCLSVSTITADGSTTIVPSISIVANRTYYFKYYLATGSTSNLKIRMVIDSWS